MIQDLSDSMIDQPEYSVASSSKSTNISITLEIKHVESVDDKSKSPKIIKELKIRGYISSVENEPKISFNLPANDELKSNNEKVNIQLKTYPSEYIFQEERKARLRETTVKYDKDSDKFVTITKKDRDLIRIF